MFPLPHPTMKIHWSHSITQWLSELSGPLSISWNLLLQPPANILKYTKNGYILPQGRWTQNYNPWSQDFFTSQESPFMEEEFVLYWKKIQQKRQHYIMLLKILQLLSLYLALISSYPDYMCTWLNWCPETRSKQRPLQEQCGQRSRRENSVFFGNHSAPFTAA